ncbi:MAG: type II toxin-antitoxin system VapC family toxin [Deltaproteobacteria bacterium]|nr:type II toxin-antitoxin system VapC family toxin [Deltaproteobacteria bacterium]
MTYLVDANVLSEPTKPVPNNKVVDWLTANEGDLVVDSIILGELCVGILALPRGRKRTQLEKWFGEVVKTIDCLPWDATISRRWAKLVVDLKQNGDTLPLLDSMIAATALQHDLTVATRNTRDFRKTGVKVLDPFA